jgi:dihydrofolate synthase/folylpolyglutamate synthase
MPHRTSGLSYLRTFPDFERGNVAATEAFGLRRILALLEEVGSPHLRLAVLHLAGTKGKGSTAAMLAAMLRAAGYKTGLFTQPHLVRIHERFTIDGTEITDQAIDSIMLDQVQPAVVRLEARGLSGVQQFEAQVALALLWFEARGVEAVVLETGLGGRLDGTNVVPRPVASVLTPIGFDHMDVLGHTLSAIAAEKAAIIRPGVPVISAPQASEASAVIEATAARAGAPLLLGERDWHVQHIEPDLHGTHFSFTLSRSLQSTTFAALWTCLLGRHQALNAGAAIATALVARVHWPRLDEQAIRVGLATVSWPGRLQLLSGAPSLLLDGAHTAESAAALSVALRDLFPARRLWLLCGIQADKDIAGFVQPLARLVTGAVATRSGHPRAAEPAQVAAALTAAGCPQVFTAPAAEEALAMAGMLAGTDDLLVVTGSLHLVGAVLALHERGHLDVGR